jgi:hypothetical protein
MKTIYKSNTRYEKVYEQMQLLGIQEVTTEQQSKNGTREFKLPIKDQHSKPIYVASFTSGYVRRTKANGYSPSWQLNKTKKTKSKHGWDMIERILIPNEADRLEYLIAFCLKNYYIGQANMLSSGRFIPKWKYDDLADPEVSVIVNNQKYKVT